VRDFGDVYLVLNRTKAWCWDSEPVNEKFGYDGKNEWFHLKQSGEVWLSPSLCFTEILGAYRNITVTSLSNMTETALSWNYHTNDYDTYAIQQQLGVTGDASSRRQFTLERPDAIQPLKLPGLGPLKEVNPDMMGQWDYTLSPGDSSYTTVIMCQFCTEKHQLGEETVLIPHRTQIAIFQDVFRATRNVAVAFQTFLTVAYGASLTTALLEANVPQAASIRSFAVVSMPTQWTGFQVVVTLAALHYIIFGLIMAAFLLKANACLGNVWHMIAQMQGEGIANFIHETTNATDKEVKQRLEERGISKSIVGVEKDVSGVIRLREKNSKTQE
jgi:hypothetical protein